MRLPNSVRLLRARGMPRSDRPWQVLVEVVASITAPTMDLAHAELPLEQAQVVLALSAARQGSELLMPAPHADQLERLGLH